jgi:hypothetical protein
MTAQLASYLTDEVHRYFPDTSVAFYTDNGGETIVLVIDHVKWSCFLDLENNYYTFESPDADVITIPLMPPPSGFADLTDEQRSFIIDTITEDIRSDPGGYAEIEALALDAQGVKDYILLMEFDSEDKE